MESMESMESIIDLVESTLDSIAIASNRRFQSTVSIRFSNDD